MTSMAYCGQAMFYSKARFDVPIFPKAIINNYSIQSNENALACLMKLNLYQGMAR
jgi:hypothetical protein